MMMNIAKKAAIAGGVAYITILAIDMLVDNVTA